MHKKERPSSVEDGRSNHKKLRVNQLLTVHDLLDRLREVLASVVVIAPVVLHVGSLQNGVPWNAHADGITLRLEVRIDVRVDRGKSVEFDSVSFRLYQGNLGPGGVVVYECNRRVNLPRLCVSLTEVECWYATAVVLTDHNPHFQAWRCSLEACG